MNKEQFIKRYCPSFIVSILKSIRHWYYVLTGFNHALAQKGELDYWKNYTNSDPTLRALLSSENWKEKIQPFALPSFTDSRLHYFFKEAEDFQAFCKKIQDKRCLEIGSGAAGDLAVMPWLKKRIFIDPLLEAYRSLQIERFGKTLFSNDVQLYSQKAEVFIPSLEHSIDGCIICVNTLDHCENPWLVLENIGRYAVSGCTLLLWSDLWHFSGLNKEHANITKDAKIVQRKLEHMGFRIERPFSGMRKDGSVADYGCAATKL